MTMQALTAELADILTTGEDLTADLRYAEATGELDEADVLALQLRRLRVRELAVRERIEAMHHEANAMLNDLPRLRAARRCVAALIGC